MCQLTGSLNLIEDDMIARRVPFEKVEGGLEFDPVKTTSGNCKFLVVELLLSDQVLWAQMSEHRSDAIHKQQPFDFSGSKLRDR
jgi:hypothetical protein